jgi:hypothetical protein
MADSHPTAGRPLRPLVGWRTAVPSAGRGGGWPARRTAWRTPRPRPSARGRPLEAVRHRPSAQPKLWSPITIDLEVRFKRVIPFWNVQVMLYNMGYLKNLLKEIFSQDTVPSAMRCFNVACSTVSCEKNSFNRFFFSSLCSRASLAHSRMVSHA